MVSGGMDAGKEGWREERGESDNLGLRELRGISPAAAGAAVRVKVSEQRSRVESHPRANCSLLLTPRLRFAFKQVFKS